MVWPPSVCWSCCDYLPAIHISTGHLKSNITDCTTIKLVNPHTCTGIKYEYCIWKNIYEYWIEAKGIQPQKQHLAQFPYSETNKMQQINSYTARRLFCKNWIKKFHFYQFSFIHSSIIHVTYQHTELLWHTMSRAEQLS